MARDCKKVRGICLKVYIWNPVDKPVKAGGGDVLHQPCRSVFGADHVDDLISFLKLSQNIRYTFRGMLQVRVHTDDAVSPTVVQSRYHGRLMSKVPGKAYHPDPWIRCGHTVQYVLASIPAAVIDKKQLIIPADLFQHMCGFPVKFFQCFFFVVDRYHNW